MRRPIRLQKISDRIMKRLRIKSFILISVMLLIAFSLSLVVVISTIIFSKSLTNSVKKEAKDRMETVIDILGVYGIDDESIEPSLEYRLTDDADYLKGRIMLIDRSYQVVRDTGLEATSSYIISDKVMSVMKGEVPSMAYDTKTDRVFIFPVNRDGKISGVVIYKASLLQVQAQLRRLFWNVITFIMFIFLVDAIVLIAISRRSVKDLNSINEKSVFPRTRASSRFRCLRRIIMRCWRSWQRSTRRGRSSFQMCRTSLRRRLLP